MTEGYQHPNVLRLERIVVWVISRRYPVLESITDVIHVGQATDIANRLSDHCRAHVSKYPFALGRPDIYAVWAMVIPNLRNGVERFVGDQLLPSGTYPDEVPQPVTLPRIG